MTKRSGQPDDLHWDPFDESLKDDPHPIWKRLRDEAPAYYNEKYDFWALSRFEDVERAHRDPQCYSSAHTTVLESMTEEPQREGMMIFLDPPEHTALRRLVSKAFTPGAWPARERDPSPLRRPSRCTAGPGRVRLRAGLWGPATGHRDCHAAGRATV